MNGVFSTSRFHLAFVFALFSLSVFSGLVCPRVNRVPNAIGDAIAKSCASVFPLRDVMIRKVKMLKKPKFDIVKLMELHGDEVGEDGGKKLGRDEPIVETMKGSGGRL